LRVICAKTMVKLMSHEAKRLNKWILKRQKTFRLK